MGFIKLPAEKARKENFIIQKMVQAEFIILKMSRFEPKLETKSAAMENYGNCLPELTVVE